MGLQSKFLFPMCQQRRDKWTAATITSTIRRLNCVPSSQESSLSGRSLRYGCTTTLHEHPDTNHSELLAKGGWVASDNSSKYTIGSVAIHLRPMRALTGYHNINMAHHPPRLDIFGDDAKNLLEQLMSVLYPTNLIEFSPGGRLRPLLRVVMATNLKNFNSKLAELTVDHVSIAATIRAADRCSTSLDQLKQWSTALQTDFEEMNMQQITPGAGLQQMYEHQSRMVEQQSKSGWNRKPGDYSTKNESKYIRCDPARHYWVHLR